MTALSFTRGAWLAALVGMLYIPRRTRQYRYMLLVPLAAALLLLVPSARERLFADIGQGGVGQAFATGQIGTGRWGLWQKLVDQAETAPVTGHGSGFAFSLDSETLFGFSGEFGTSRSTFVYPHNDFLFWGLEFGLIGVGLYVAFWLLLRGGYKRLMGQPNERVRRDAVLLSGVLATMLIAELVDNGIFIRPIADRFFVAAGAMLALASGSRAGEVE
jgi:O-antigen ligase